MAGERVDGAVGIGEFGAALSILLYVGPFNHRGQHAVGAGHADAAGDRAVFREGVAELETAHGVVLGRGIRPGQVVGDQLIGLAPIKVIGIDGGKRLLDQVFRHQDGVSGAPGFGPAFGDLVAADPGGHVLETVFDRDLAGEFVADRFLEQLLEIAADDKHHLAKTGADGVIDRIFENDLAIRTDRIDLLEAAIAAAHAGSHHQKRWFHN